MKRCKRLSYLFLLVAVLSSCTIPDRLAKRTEACKDVFCTEEFKSIAITVVDSKNNPVLLKEYYVNLPSDKSVFSSGRNASTNIYTIASDSLVRGKAWGMPRLSKDDPKKITYLISFNGTTNDNRKVSAEYTVSADCCHVYLASGPDKIIVP